MRMSFVTRSVMTCALGLWLAACGGKSDGGGDAATTAAGDAVAASGDARVIDLTDSNDLADVAYRSLLAYRDKNMQLLADLGPPGAREKLIFIEPRNPHYEELLGDGTWQMKSLRAWDGQKESVKIRRGIDTAFGYYGEDADSSFVVEVRKETFKACQNGKKACKEDADCAAPAPTPAPEEADAGANASADTATYAAGGPNPCESQTRWTFHNLKKMPKAGGMAAPSPESTKNIGEPPKP